MAYVHCHNCGWEQDDFYSKDYNPAKFLLTWNDYLFGDRHSRIDQQFSDDANFLKENGSVTAREVLAREYERFAHRIRTMKWVTFEDFKNDSDKVCPQCHSEELDID